MAATLHDDRTMHGWHLVALLVAPLAACTTYGTEPAPVATAAATNEPTSDAVKTDAEKKTTTEPQGGAPAVDTRSLCVREPTHAHCIDFEASDAPAPLTLGSFRPSGSCGVTETAAQAGKRSLLCKQASMQIFTEDTTSITLATDIFVDGRTKTDGLVEVAGIDVNLKQGFGPHLAWRIWFVPEDPNGRVELSVGEEAPTRPGVFSPTEFKTAVLPNAWHRFEIHLSVVGGVMSVEAKADGVLTFSGKLRNRYDDVTNFRAHLDGDGMKSSTEALGVHFDNVTID